MIWANFLHIYQPPNQQKDILDRIANESYRPILRGLKEHSRARLTLNINGGLTEMLAQHGYRDIINDIALMVKRGRLELTETAKYHTFFPLLPETEIVRQIKLNRQANRKYFGSVYNPKGFFPTEMAYHPKIAKIAKSLGYEWMIADEISAYGKAGAVDFTKVYTVKGLGDFKIFFKEQRTSSLIVGAVVRSGETLLEELGEERTKNRYLVTAMDGETFGHHRPGLEKLLFEIFESPLLHTVLMSEIPDHFQERSVISPVPSSWSTSEEDLKNNLPYKLWWQPDNPIHQLQWKFTKFVIDRVEHAAKNPAQYKRGRLLLDKAIHSDHYWWASKYWWSLEVIEQGAKNLRDTVFALRSATASDKKKADGFYRAILDQAFEWQRDGTIRTFHGEQQGWQKTPFKKRTPPEWFNQMVLEFEDEMNKAASKQEFEKAIKWRDAVIKLKSGMDVHDVLHVVNELHAVRTIPSVKPFLEHTKFSNFAREHFEKLPKGSKQPKGDYLPPNHES